MQSETQVRLGGRGDFSTYTPSLGPEPSFFCSSIKLHNVQVLASHRNLHAQYQGSSSDRTPGIISEHPKIRSPEGQQPPLTRDVILLICVHTIFHLQSLPHLWAPNQSFTSFSIWPMHNLLWVLNHILFEFIFNHKSMKERIPNSEKLHAILRKA